MEKRKVTVSNRRQFITKTIPACAMTCLCSQIHLARAETAIQQTSQQENHKFDKTSEPVLSYRQLMRVRYNEAMNLIKSLEKANGKKWTIDFLRNQSSERMLINAKAQARKSADNTFSTFVEMFRGGYENTLTKEVVEDTPETFELKVTECIWASTFLEAMMGEYGYVLVCWADYAWAEGFNPNIKLIRDKTLMQGDECCNHRYILKG